MASKVISSIWYGIKLPMLSKRMIGIVAVQCEITGKVKFYIGLGTGEDQEHDEQMVYKMGVPFYPLPLIEWILTFTQNERNEKK